LGIGGGGTLEKLEVVLKSRALSSRVITNHDLMPILFPKKWDAGKKKWITTWLSDKPPTIQDGMEVIQEDLLKVNRDKKIILLSLNSRIVTRRPSKILSITTLPN